MVKVLFTVLCVFLLFLTNTKRKKTLFIPSNFLIGIYLLSLICAVLDIYLNEDKLLFNSIYWEPIIIFIIQIFLFLFPFIYFKENRINELILPDIKLLIRISNILILISGFIILYSVPFVIDVFRGGSAAAAHMRDLVYAGENAYRENTNIYLQWIISLLGPFFVWDIVLYFIFKILNISTKRCVCLLVGSLYYMLTVLVYAGRDGVVFWIFAFIFCLLFFKRFMSKTILKSLIKKFTLLTIAMMFPFMIISIGRFNFSGTYDSNTTNALVSYMGQQLKHYCAWYETPQRPMTYGACFPLFWKMLGQTPTVSHWETSNTSSIQFGFFLRDFNLSIGVFASFLLAIFSSLVFIRFFKQKRERLRFSYLFIYFLYYTVLNQGVFYFKQYGFAGNFFLILNFILFFYFQEIQKKTTSPIILKTIE